jgi:hypothetical protein
MNRPVKLGRVLAAVVLSAAATAQISSAPGSDRSRHELDGRLAVQWHRDVGRADRLARLRQAGFAIDRIEPTGLPDWDLLTLGRPLREPDARAATARLANLPGLEIASPVFRGAFPGAWFTITRDLIVWHAADQAIDGFELRAERLGGLADVSIVSTAERDGFAVLAHLDRLALDRRVLWVEPDALFSGRSAATPNDPGFAYLWGMRNRNGLDLDADVAWNITMGSASEPVLVLDSGVEMSHPDLNIGGGADFTIAPGPVPGGPGNACDMHGTAVAGCISAIIDNALGTVGVAPSSPTLSARVFVSNPTCDGTWTSQASWTVSALGWGLTRGARISNNSNLYGFASVTIDAQYSATRAAGMIHFAAAGNSGQPTLSYPASLSTVNAVSAVDPSGALAGFSNHGAGIAFAAPGVAIYTTDLTGPLGFASGDYAFLQGTSFAAPYVAGVAALVRSVRPGILPDAIEQVLAATARDLGTPGRDPLFGHGFVDAHAAVLPPGLAVFGSGTPGCEGPHTLSATATPTLGSRLDITCNAAPPGSAGVLLLQSGAVPPGHDPLGLGVVFLVALNQPPAFLTISSDAAGDATSPLVVPSIPVLVGITGYLQALWAWSTCVPSTPWSASSSDGLALTILR